MYDVSDNFKLAADAQDNSPSLVVDIAWGIVGYSTIDETVNLVDCQFSSEGSMSYGKLLTQQATTFGKLTLFNKDYRYTPDRVNSSFITVDEQLWPYITDFPEDGFVVYISGTFDMTDFGGFAEEHRVFEGRIVDYTYDEISNLVNWTLVDMTWVDLQRKDSTEVYSNEDYASIEYSSLDPINSQRTNYVWIDDDSKMNDSFKMSNAVLGTRFENAHTGDVEFQSTDTWFINNRDDDDNLTPLYYFDPTHSYTNMSSGTSIQTRPTELVCSFSPRYVGPTQVLFELDEPLICPVAVDDETPTSKVFYLKSDLPIYEYLLPTEGVDYEIISGNGINMSGYTTVDFTFTAQQIQVTITNSHEYYDAGMRYLTIYGNPVFGGPSGKERRTVVGGSFKRTQTIGDPFYIQTRPHAKWLVDILEDRVKYVIPTRLIQDSPPLFYLHVGDLVEYKVVNGESRTKAFIGSVRTNYTQGQLTQSFVLIDYDYLYPAPDENYFVIGDSLDDTKVAFY